MSGYGRVGLQLSGFHTFIWSCLMSPTCPSLPQTLQVLGEAGCALVGGHTCEGEETSLGEWPLRGEGGTRGWKVGLYGCIT